MLKEEVGPADKSLDVVSRVTGIPRRAPECFEGPDRQSFTAYGGRLAAASRAEEAFMRVVDAVRPQAWPPGSGPRPETGRPVSFMFLGPEPVSVYDRAGQGPWRSSCSKPTTRPKWFASDMSRVRRKHLGWPVWWCASPLTIGYDPRVAPAEPKSGCDRRPSTQRGSLFDEDPRRPPGRVSTCPALGLSSTMAGLDRWTRAARSELLPQTPSSY